MYEEKKREINRPRKCFSRFGFALDLLASIATIVLGHRSQSIHLFRVVFVDIQVWVVSRMSNNH
jgi:hypothetical protein